MPLYEYQCDACGHRFEAIQKFSDPLVETCPKCGGAVQKLIAAPAFHLKGTGWYITDYAKKDSGGGAGKSEGAASSTGSTTAPASSSGDAASGSANADKSSSSAPSATSTTSTPSASSGQDGKASKPGKSDS